MNTRKRRTWRSSAALFVPILAGTILLGCRGGSPSGLDVPPPSLDPASPRLSAVDTTFDRAELSVPAGQPFVLVFENRDTGSHNVSIYADDARRDKLFDGEIFSGPGMRWYPVPALAPGAYVFACDLHLTMRGTLTAS